MVGIKGAGMASLAVLLKQRGVRVSGSDTDEFFIPQQQLSQHAIPWTSLEDISALEAGFDTLIYSTAYDPDTTPQIARGRVLGMDIFSYNEYIGKLSHAAAVCCCIAGTHGKSTTSAMIDYLLQCQGYVPETLYGTEITDRSLLPEPQAASAGSAVLLVEACEYRLHFHLLSPSVAVITSIDFDHPDCFTNLAAVEEAFLEFGRRIRQRGMLIYCADDQRVCAVAETLAAERADIVFIPYSGSDIPGDRALIIPGWHMVQNTAAALAAVEAVTARMGRMADLPAVLSAAVHFPGCRGRTEVLGEAEGVIVIDDYAHHPAEIAVTLEGLRTKYPGRCFIVDFMPHTYSRTETLFAAFVSVLQEPDLLILHPVFSSRRESYHGDADPGRRLADEIDGARYANAIDDAVRIALQELHQGDIFISMGAGNNREVAEEVLRELIRREREC